MTGLESVQIRFLRILTAIFALEKKYVQPHVGCILQAVIPLVYQRPSPGSTASNLAELGLPPGTTVSGLADEVSRSLNKICNDRLYYFVFDLFYHPDNRIKKWALRFFITVRFFSIFPLSSFLLSLSYLTLFLSFSSLLTLY